MIVCKDNFTDFNTTYFTVVYAGTENDPITKYTILHNYENGNIHT